MALTRFYISPDVSTDNGNPKPALTVPATAYYPITKWADWSYDDPYTTLFVTAYNGAVALSPRAIGSAQTSMDGDITKTVISVPIPNVIDSNITLLIDGGSTLDPNSGGYQDTIFVLLPKGDYKAQTFKVTLVASDGGQHPLQQDGTRAYDIGVGHASTDIKPQPYQDAFIDIDYVGAGPVPVNVAPLTSPITAYGGF